MNGRELLIYFSLKYEGDFSKMLDAIKRKEQVNEKDIKASQDKVKSKVITILDKEYPKELTHICMPPLVLYYYGDISLLKGNDTRIAVIGSRESSKYGEEVTTSLTKTLVKGKRVIVSGMARGIDRIAHETAINNNGKTIAVLGSGIDYIYPKTNADIYEKMKKDHLIISEYPNDLAPKPENFPQRNRIVAGLSDKVLVTEAYVNSGTSITVLHALKQGKDVLAVPYPINSNSACNKLIQDGAYLIDSSDDVIYYTEEKKWKKVKDIL